MFIHAHSHKHVPLAKVVVPAGLDAAGHPIGLQFMSRAGPVGATDLSYTFDDALLRTLDVPFLQNVATLVDAMTRADPSLARAEPGMVSRDLAP